MLKFLIKRKHRKVINEINNFEEELKLLTNQELKFRFYQLQQFYKEKQNLQKIISKSFALTREVSSRILGLRHYDVQLLGGLVLNEGKIAEIQTGEGKTLVATLPASLNALERKGVHIVTVNDYLANRDQKLMGQIYRFLGLRTGIICQSMNNSDRKKNYYYDITYVTNKELGFDYLRDNLVLRQEDLVLRSLNFCIIDEIDSILIDEAQNPLIISNNVTTSIDKYIISSEISSYLKIGIHFKLNEKNKNIILTKEGTFLIENILQIKDLYDPKDPWIPYIINSLKALTLFFLNIHYIINNNKIIIIDELTGRPTIGKRWNNGLHQAIEAKEKVCINPESEIVAEISYQNFFLLYSKLSGMSGTAKSSLSDFNEIYDLPVVIIPPYKPNIRKDLKDTVYPNEKVKWDSIVSECKRVTKTMQPILIGTTTIEKSEKLGKLLNKYNLKHQILNAKPENIVHESEIIAQAGERNCITIATNMAGRGTDIILGGNINFIVYRKLYKILTFYHKNSMIDNVNYIFPLYNSINSISQRFLNILESLINNPEFLKLTNIDLLKILKNFELFSYPSKIYENSIKYLQKDLLIYERKQQKVNNTLVKNIGGLYVVGSERNNYRRIDDQLKGRCGRQGDPGISKFFLSLEDPLLRIFGGTHIKKLIKDQLITDLPLESNFITTSIKLAQNKLEENNYNFRRSLFSYDEIINKQRILIYTERRIILESKTLKSIIISYGEQIISEMLGQIKRSKVSLKMVLLTLENILDTKLETNIPDKLNITFDNTNFLKLKSYIFKKFWLTYSSKILEYEVNNHDSFQNIERLVILNYMDNGWKNLLKKMEILRESVMWRYYGGNDPLFEYQEESLKLFKNQWFLVRYLIIYNVMRISYFSK